MGLSRNLFLSSSHPLMSHDRVSGILSTIYTPPSLLFSMSFASALYRSADSSLFWSLFFEQASASLQPFSGLWSRACTILQVAWGQPSGAVISNLGSTLASPTWCLGPTFTDSDFIDLGCGLIIKVFKTWGISNEAEVRTIIPLPIRGIDGCTSSG